MSKILNMNLYGPQELGADNYARCYRFHCEAQTSLYMPSGTDSKPSQGDHSRQRAESRSWFLNDYLVRRSRAGPCLTEGEMNQPALRMHLLPVLRSLGLHPESLPEVHRRDNNRPARSTISQNRTSSISTTTHPGGLSQNIQKGI